MVHDLRECWVDRGGKLCPELRPRLALHDPNMTKYRFPRDGDRASDFHVTKRHAPRGLKGVV